MVGSLTETHYAEIRERVESDQQQLPVFSGGPTTIAVVQLPRDTGIEEICDEWWPELGMPERHLRRFWSYKQGYKTNSAIKNPIEQAYEDARLEHYYRRHIETSDEAQQALSELVSRLRSGEDITLVCFEKPTEPCHRHQLKEIVEARVSGLALGQEGEPVTQ